LRTRKSLSVPTLLFTSQPRVAGLEATSCLVSLVAAILLLWHSRRVPADDRYDGRRQRQQVNAIHRAGGDTQVATGAFVDDDGVHELCCADDSVDRAGLNALGAANAFSFPDKRDLCWRRTPLRIDAQGGNAEQLRQSRNGLIATRRTFVDRLALGYSFCVRLAAGMPAFSALGLGQQGVDALDKVHGFAE
jgi:hypothetical protein